MPIYKRSYRSYTGHTKQRFRWRIIVEQELRILIKSRIFILLMTLPLLHTLLRFLQILAYDVIMQDPNNPLTPILMNLQGVVVNRVMFFDFIRIQTPMLFLIILYAGAGMICNDFRNNLIEVYFSKPIHWYDYALGKVITLLLIGLSITALPGIFLVVLHNALLPSAELFWETLWWPPLLLLFSLIIILPCIAVTLACSTLLGSFNFAAVSVLMVVTANSAMGVLLSLLAKSPDFLLVSFPITLNYIGERLFTKPHNIFSVRWEWSLLYILVVSLWGLLVIFKRIRRAEVAA